MDAHHEALTSVINGLVDKVACLSSSLSLPAVQPPSRPCSVATAITSPISGTSSHPTAISGAAPPPSKNSLLHLRAHVSTFAAEEPIFDTGTHDSTTPTTVPALGITAYPSLVSGVLAPSNLEFYLILEVDQLLPRCFLLYWLLILLLTSLRLNFLGGEYGNQQHLAP